MRCDVFTLFPSITSVYPVTRLVALLVCVYKFVCESMYIDGNISHGTEDKKQRFNGVFQK